MTTTTVEPSPPTDPATPSSKMRRIVAVAGTVAGIVIGIVAYEHGGGSLRFVIGGGIVVVLWQAIDTVVKTAVDETDSLLPGWLWLSRLIELAIACGAIAAICTQQFARENYWPVLGLIVLSLAAFAISWLRIRRSPSSSPPLTYDHHTQAAEQD